MDTTFHTVTVDRSRPEAEPIEIEDEVWLCTKSTVLPGVRIGRGSVVAAHAVVTRDVPAGMIVAGVPAKVIGEVPGAAEAAASRPRPNRLAAVRTEPLDSAADAGRTTPRRAAGGAR